jgi:hypothetical protein
MRLPDPYVDLAAPGFSSAKLVDVDPYITDTMPNGTVLRTKVASQYWTLDLSYPDLTENEFRILYSAIAESKRLSTTIDVLLPQYEQYHVQGDATTANITDGSNGSEVTITDLTSLTGTPRVGSLFKLSTHSKVYRIASIDIQPGFWKLGLFPNLSITTLNAKPIFNNILLEMTLTTDSLPIEDVSVDGFYRGVSISLREQLNG